MIKPCGRGSDVCKTLEWDQIKFYFKSLLKSYFKITSYKNQHYSSHHSDKNSLQIVSKCATVHYMWQPCVEVHTIQGHHCNALLNDHAYFARSACTHLGLWWNLNDCLLHHFTTSQCILKCVQLTYSTTSNWLAGIWKWDFSTPSLGGGWLRGCGESRWAHSIALPWVPISSYWHIWSTPVCFWVI